jgi:hypothetical protein
MRAHRSSWRHPAVLVAGLALALPFTSGAQAQLRKAAREDKPAVAPLPRARKPDKTAVKTDKPIKTATREDRAPRRAAVPLRKEQARSRHKLHKRQTPARSAPPHLTGSIIWVDAQGRCLSAREIAESRHTRALFPRRQRHFR